MLSVELASLYVMESRAYERSGMKVIYYDQCPQGCMSYSDPRYSSLLSCKFCSTPRYYPASIRVASAKSRFEKAQPPLDKQPRSQHAFCDIEPLLDALRAHTEHGPAMVEISKASILASEKNFPIITDIGNGLLARNLFGPGGLGEYDILLSTSSDAADVVPERNPLEKINAHFAGTNILSLPIDTRFKHANTWIYSITGPTKAKDTMSFLAPVVKNLLRLEAPKQKYSAAAGKAVWTRAFLFVNPGDTVEQKETANVVGASGKFGSFVCNTEAIYTSNHYSPLLTTPPGLTRPHVLLPTGPQIPGGQLQEIRTYEQYRAACKRILEARNPTAAKAIATSTGIKGPSIFENVSLFSALYPWFFALDLMHAGYANRIKDIDRILVGKEASAHGEFLNRAKIKLMADIQMKSRAFKPTALGGTVRSVETKLGSWKCAEFRTFTLQDLVPLCYGVLPQKDMDFVVTLVKAARLLEARVLDKDGQENSSYPTYSFDDEGDHVVSFSDLQKAVDTLSIESESILVNGNLKYAHLASPTALRLTHAPAFALAYGPLIGFSQWGFESKIGESE